MSFPLLFGNKNKSRFLMFFVTVVSNKVAREFVDPWHQPIKEVLNLPAVILKITFAEK
jgi:argonaute-like protein implicated in RNA metabolism and viral defense